MSHDLRQYTATFAASKIKKGAMTSSCTFDKFG